MADFRPVIYAFGRSNETTSPGISAGATTITVASTAGMVQGEAIFVIEDDDTETESMGAITSIDDGTTLQVDRGPLLEKDADAKVWTATYSAAMPYPISGRPAVETRDGIERNFTVDGLTHNTQTADPGEFWVIRYTQVTNSSLAALRTFLSQTSGANYGVADFVVSMWDYESDAAVLATVRLASAMPPYVEGVRGVSSYSLRVQVVTESSYPA